MHHLRDYTGPLAPAAFGVARRFVRYEIGEVEPIRDVAEISPRPVLLVHGARDSVTPCEHSKRLYEVAKEPKELWIVPDAGHIEAYFKDRRTYSGRVGDFFERTLG